MARSKNNERGDKVNELREVIVRYICLSDDGIIRSTRCTISEATDLINLIKTTNAVYIEGVGENYDGDYIAEWIIFVPAIDEKHLDVVKIMLEPDDL